ncbi:MAG TPA: hypothetical protein VMP11_14000 [Verrucomicrobiae bacterium]|nr:hypothetical protein [Verrucomicrobiae bacterium]
MAAGDLSDALLQFIRLCIPSFEAAELLLFLAQHADRSWRAEEIAREIKPNVPPLPRIRECLALFQARGLATEQSESYQFAPGSPELRSAVDALARAYEERPVTLIRTINSIADQKLQSFAEAFKFKKD